MRAPSLLVGAGIARPPKNVVFRIFKREITAFRLAAMDFAKAKSADDQWSPLRSPFGTHRNGSP